MILDEGLRENDLEGLVIPVISIDQFESKIDDDAIVVAFYVEYKEPAIDLNRFIQKSAVDILDTEVSPAPTEEGYYVVFVELERSSAFPKSLVDILENIENLVGFDQWQFVCYGTKGVHNLDIETIESTVRLTSDPEDSDDSDVSEEIDRSVIERIMAEGRKRIPTRHNAVTMADLKAIIDP